MRIILLSMVLFAGAGSTAAVTLESSVEQALAVELFTSEGCSSCPPAEDWFNALSEHDQLWQRFVPLVWHVDYWDRLGWPDRFASPAYSERQREYAARKAAKFVYTPGVFLDGREFRGWRRQARLRFPATDTVGVLRLTVADEALEVEFAPTHSNSQLRGHVALLGMDLKTQVNAGENRGRNLEHDFVVLATTSQPLRRQGNEQYQASFASLQPTVSAPSYAIVAWVTEDDELRPLQAVGGWLEDGL